MTLKLSVFVVTYNQEKYIERCLNSIVEQKVDFDYEIIIGEDCSTDNTPIICDKFASQHKNVKVFHHANNLGHVKNWEFVLNNCTGEYIAMIEGDDFWTDISKLQTQVDYLDTHKEYALTFHKIQLVYEGKDLHETIFTDLQEGDYTAEEIYYQWSILTSSVMFRAFHPKISFPKGIYFSDIYLFLTILKTGKCRCLDICATAYRRHSDNLSSSKDISLSIKLYKQYQVMKKHFPKYNVITNNHIAYYLHDLAYNHTDRKSVKYMVIYMLKHPIKIVSYKYWRRLLRNLVS